MAIISVTVWGIQFVNLPPVFTVMATIDYELSARVLYPDVLVGVSTEPLGIKFYFKGIRG